MLQKSGAFLQGGGEMGELTRGLDWSSTSIGMPDSWPQSLRTTVSNLLRSKFPMFLWWGEDMIQFYNDAYRPSLGNEGKHPHALGAKGPDTWPEIWDIISPLHKQVETTGEATWMEDQLVPIYRNGKIEDVYWTFSYSSVLNDEGRHGGILVTCTETTEKVNTFNNLQTSEQRFENLIRDATAAIIVLIGPEMKVEIVNKSYGELIERTPEELLGRPLFSVIPEAEAFYLPILESVRTTGEPVYLYDSPYSVVTNGKKIEGYLNVVYQPYKNAVGEILGVMAILQNVTAQVKARKALEDSEERLRFALEAGGLGSWELELDTLVLQASEHCKANFGQPLDKPFMYETLVSCIHPDDRQRQEEAVQKTVTTGVDYDIEYRVVWPNGSLHWVNVRGQLRYNKEGRPVRMAGVSIEVTQRVMARQQIEAIVEERTKELAAANASLQLVNKELQRSNAHLEEFAHAASHDLKEPIRKIHFFTNKLKGELNAALHETHQNALSRIENATGRMGALIDDLLLYSHVSQRPHEKEPVDLNEKISRVLEDLDLDIEEKGATITVGLLPIIEGYGRQLQQLFQNLISNSLKYSKASVAPQITVQACEHSEENTLYQCIWVEDNGIGFAQEYHEKIFQMFSRLHGKHEYAGTGIGLSIVKKIVENHGGFIRVESVPDEGTRFSIYLPGR